MFFHEGYDKENFVRNLKRLFFRGKRILRKQDPTLIMDALVDLL